MKTSVGRDRIGDRSDDPSEAGPAGPTVGQDDEGENRQIVPEWIAHAVCKGRTSLFFGIAGERPERRVRREAAARKLCGECPVRMPCRILARINRENGFWGGESEEERAAAGFAPKSIARRSVQAASAQHVSISPHRARAAAS